MFDLKGQVAVVTGASSGLGKQMAKGFASRGANLAILARRIERLEEFAKELHDEFKVKVLPVQCDVTSTESINAVLREYPKVLLLSMPIMPVIEALHKFTLSYNVTILTFHDGQIIVANAGKVVTTPLEKTSYSPISLWSGELAAKISAMNLFTPGKPLETAVFSINFK